MRRFPPLPAVLALLALLSLAACSPAEPPQPIPAQSIPLVPGQKVLIQVDRGQVTVVPSQTGALELSGSIAAPQQVEYSLANEAGEVRLQARYRRALFQSAPSPVVTLQVALPPETELRLEGFDAAVDLSGLSGKIVVDSVAGDIRAAGLSGEIVLRSGRGDVQASSCSGDLRLVGEHGLLEVQESRGQIGLVTIMGTLRYTGKAQAGDSVHMETDHGPVQAFLEPGADVTIEATTTSGQVTCLAPGLQPGLRTCRGQLGAGAGRLEVRTTSGSITIEQQP